MTANTEKNNTTPLNLPPGCLHPWVFAWSGKCEGCRHKPLSRNLPDPKVRGMGTPDD
jgi:hypothetical protein